MVGTFEMPWRDAKFDLQARLAAAQQLANKFPGTSAKLPFTA